MTNKMPQVDTRSQGDAPGYDPHLADHGFEPVESEGLTYPLGDFQPEFGEFFELMPGIGWTRTPVPGPLGHINNWVLDDVHPDGEPGFAIVDTGLFMPETIAAWKNLFEDGALKGKRATKIIATHFHPDHAGCVGWLANRFKAKVYMNRTEWMLVRMMIAGRGSVSTDNKSELPNALVDQWFYSGWTQEQVDQTLKLHMSGMGLAVSELPMKYVHIDEGAHIDTGDHDWRIMTGHGHTPEHSCLVDDKAKVMISGDQILPRITSNISVMPNEPEANPLGDWLDSIARFRGELASDLLVLPAHGRPFVGVQQRLDALGARHEESLEALMVELRQREMTIIDGFPWLFAREITDDLRGMATGEAVANFHLLLARGQVTRDIRDGVAWFRAA